MYEMEFFNLGRFKIDAFVSDIKPTKRGLDFRVDHLQCSYEGEVVGTVHNGYQAFVEWLGLRGLNFFEAIEEELEMQEYALRDYQMPFDEAANY